MADPQDEPKLLLPGLKAFYDVVIPVSWFIVRAAAGWNLLIHGWGKIAVGPTPGFLKAPVGDYILSLGKRIDKLEREVEQLERQQHSRAGGGGIQQ